MPKKTLKKLRSQYRRTPKTARLARFRTVKAAKEKARNLAREGKALNAALEDAESNYTNEAKNNFQGNNNFVNNGTNIPVPASVVAPVNVNEKNENIIDPMEFWNPEYRYNTPAVGRAKRYPPSRKVKQAKKNRVRTQKQKQRLLNLRRTRARQGKEAERKLEEANLESLPPETYTMNNYYNNIPSLTSEERNRLDLEDYIRAAEEQDKYIAEQEMKQYKKNMEAAMKELETLRKNYFYIRINSKKPFSKVSTLLKLIKSPSFHANKLEILYISEDPLKSYYKLLKWYVEEEENYNRYNNYFGNDYMYGRPRYRERDLGWKVYNLKPFEFFMPTKEPIYSIYDYYNNNNDYNEYENRRNRSLLGRYASLLRNRKDLKQYLLGLPFFAEKVKAEEQAVYTAPGKLESLQLKGLEGTIQAFEKKTGKTVPRDTQNIIERYLMRRPPPSTYFQQRDNIYRIHPNLFTEGEVNMPRHLKKIHTDLLNKST